MIAMSIHNFRTSSLLFILATTACALATAGCESTIIPPEHPGGWVMVEGGVTAPDGAPVADASVRARAFDLATCAEPREAGGRVFPDAGGRFRIEVWTGDIRELGCIRVTAEPSAASGLREATEEIRPVEWSSPRTEHPDTVRVDIMLEADEG